MKKLQPFTRPYDLPERADTGGFVYVIEYSSQLVKVGSTTKPRSRFVQLKDAAESHGVSISRYWLSQSHHRYLDSEAKLVGICRPMASEVRKAEYFLGVDADVVVRRFKRWDGSVPGPAVRPHADADLDDPFYRDIAELTEHLGGPWPPDAEERAAIAILRRRRLRGEH